MAPHQPPVKYKTPNNRKKIGTKTAQSLSIFSGRRCRQTVSVFHGRKAELDNDNFIHYLELGEFLLAV